MAIIAPMAESPMLRMGGRVYALEPHLNMRENSQLVG
jgi:hypothetical protein